MGRFPRTIVSWRALRPNYPMSVGPIRPLSRPTVRLGTGRATKRTPPDLSLPAVYRSRPVTAGTGAAVAFWAQPDPTSRKAAMAPGTAVEPRGEMARTRGAPSHVSEGQWKDV